MSTISLYNEEGCVLNVNTGKRSEWDGASMEVSGTVFAGAIGWKVCMRLVATA